MTYLGHCMILGEAKCGTSSFHQLLINSGYFISSSRKELHYFDRACRRAWNYDPAFRPNAKDYDTAIRDGEDAQRETYYTLDSTPAYFRTPGVPELVVQLTPSRRKYFVLLRDPVARLYSNYWMLKRRGHYAMLKQHGQFQSNSDNFSAIIDEFILEDQFAQRGEVPSFDYAYNLSRWKKVLGSLEDMKVLFFEDLFSSPRSAIAEVSAFLDIDIRVPRTLPRIIPGADRDATPANHYPRIRVEDDQRLRSFFKEPNARLTELLGMTLPWN